MRVLCFTTSYHRPKMLRGCILDILNQKYPSIVHGINITHDSDEDLEYECVYDDILANELVGQIQITKNLNANQQINHLSAIQNVVGYKNFDLFVKIDDDDVYKNNYVANIVKFFRRNEVDVTTSMISHQINGYYIQKGKYGSLGANPEGSTFQMPMTIAFNRNGLDAILNLESFYGSVDIMWRDSWHKNGLIHKVINNTDQVVWHIHGKNISTADFLIKD